MGNTVAAELVLRKMEVFPPAPVGLADIVAAPASRTCWCWPARPAGVRIRLLLLVTEEEVKL